jgi:hypothetical protein
MKIVINPAVARMVSFWSSLLLAAPGFYVGWSGLADEMGPQGIPWLLELLGFVGFYLLMTVLGLEASMEHKGAFTGLLQPVGAIAAILLVLRAGLGLRRRLGDAAPRRQVGSESPSGQSD